MSNWEQTGTIIKETFQMAGKDKSLYVPPVLSLLFNAVFVIFAIMVIIAGGVASDAGASMSPYVIIAILFLFLGYLSSAIMSGALSWMVLEVKQGKKPSFGRGVSKAFSKFGSLIIYSLVSLVVMLIAGQLRKEGENQNFIVSIIKSIFADMIEKAWDIASHLLLPAIILTKNNFGGAIKEMPQMLKHLPQVLVGGFAFDFVVGWIYAIEIVLGIVMMFLIPGVGFWLGIGFILVALPVTYIFYSFVKDVYFTILYIDLHPELKKRTTV